MDYIFIDSNQIYIDSKKGKSFANFFGNAQKIKKFENIANICVPCIVIDEIKRQKKRSLQGEIDKIKDTFLYSNYSWSDKKFLEDGLSKIEDLYKNSQNEFKYSEVKLNHDAEHLNKLRNFSIENKAPFDSDSDKGFKDAYIYLTLLDFIEDGKNIFLWTKDNRLKNAFSTIKNIQVISEIEEFLSYKEKYFKDDYFLEKVKEYIEYRINKIKSSTTSDPTFHNVSDVKFLNNIVNCVYNIDYNKISKDTVNRCEINSDDEWEISFDLTTAISPGMFCYQPLRSSEIKRKPWVEDDIKVEIKIVVDFYSKEILDLKND